MISLSNLSPAVGDTVRLTWDFPAGSKVIVGPSANDSLVVSADTARAGHWVLQPLAAGTYTLDTLQAITPGGDTLREAAPPWQVSSRLESSDTTASRLLAPQDVPVPFPWDRVGWAALGAALLVALLFAWKRWRRWRQSRTPPAPPPPPRDPVEVARELLDALVKRAEAGASAREIAFECGELLRDVHGKLHAWPDATGSTSGQWKEWCQGKRTAEECSLLAEFLREADMLRYADGAGLAGQLLTNARLLLDATDRLRKVSP
ncbi:MAG TPA: hypothetical protein PKO15_11470 [Fibrobacteria bacterium]|nr:hypothetical protein [Fibrobacteria bacterium]HOX50416.1 hypothetical protein [Fibrobacteria bacterium]